MAYCAFRETQEAAAEVTRLFDFAWPTAVALWNLRWQVDGFLRAVPEATHDDVSARFVVGSDIRGADIKSMIKNVSWESQKEKFSEFILTNVFSIYESWASGLARKINIRNIKDNNFAFYEDKNKNGIKYVISVVNSRISTSMSVIFHQNFVTAKKVYIDQLPAMMRCYRYFKEIRNSHIHNGGVAGQRAVDAYLEFVPFSSTSELRTKEAIEHYEVKLGERARLSLRGVVGFCDIIIRLMITIDAIISGSEVAEREVIERIKISNSGGLRTLSSDSIIAAGQVRGICRRAALPPPVDVDCLRAFLVENHLVLR